MAPSLSNSLRNVWRSTTRLDRVVLAVVALYAAIWVAGLLGQIAPGARFFRFLFFLSLIYLAFRGVTWLRRDGLWSLRTRLAVAYLFIAVVPVFLLIAMGALSAYIIYSQLGAYLLQNDLQKRMDKVAAIAEAVAGQVAGRAESVPSGGASPLESMPEVAALISAASPLLPGLQIRIGDNEWLLEKHGGPNKDRFTGLVQEGKSIWLRSVIARPVPYGTGARHSGPARRGGKGPAPSLAAASTGRVIVSASAPVTEDLLGTIAPELGIVQMTVWRPASEGDSQGLVFEAENGRFVPIGQIVGRNRTLPEASGWMDFEVTGTCKFEAVPVGNGDTAAILRPVFAPFSARTSQLNRRLSSSLGELGSRPLQLLVFVGVVFLVIEGAALQVGVRLTASITRAVDELSRATQHVQDGDFTHTVRIHQRDQLGALGESFNEMISSISNLIEGQRQRQRLENELTIAHEVQAQLFPQTLPQLPGIELAAVCRAARVVSGDYYDFVSLGPGRLGFVIADISGKGISAALLMASLQAALRSQVLLDSQKWEETAELVLRMNRHLFLNTSSDRYATLFYAAFDAETRTLHYTNAGHLPPIYIVGEQVRQLEEGGMVVGLFDDCVYEQGTIHVEPGALLVAYSDGLVECENVYGEEFGRKGIRAELLRRKDETPQQIAEGLVQAAEEWTGSPEQADDMTVIVARLG